MEGLAPEQTHRAGPAAFHQHHCKHSVSSGSRPVSCLVPRIDHWQNVCVVACGLFESQPSLGKETLVQGNL